MMTNKTSLLREKKRVKKLVNLMKVESGFCYVTEDEHNMCKCSNTQETDWDERKQVDYELFDVDMILEQLEDYGKYNGVLHIGCDECENYIPVSVAKKIVKAKGLGGVLGYME